MTFAVPHDLAFYVAFYVIFTQNSRNCPWERPGGNYYE